MGGSITSIGWGSKCGSGSGWGLGRLFSNEDLQPRYFTIQKNADDVQEAFFFQYYEWKAGKAPVLKRNLPIMRDHYLVLRNIGALTLLVYPKPNGEPLNAEFQPEKQQKANGAQWATMLNFADASQRQEWIDKLVSILDRSSWCVVNGNNQTLTKERPKIRNYTDELKVDDELLVRMMTGKLGPWK